MKRTDLIRTIETFECVLIRHGARHDWYQNPETKIPNLFHGTVKLRNLSPNSLSKCCEAMPVMKAQLKCWIDGFHENDAVGVSIIKGHAYDLFGEVVEEFASG